jgi:hypothetical protein
LNLLWNTCPCCLKSINVFTRGEWFLEF